MSAGSAESSPLNTQPDDWCASEQFGARPVFAEHVVVEKGEDRLVPDHRVSRLEDPVVLIGEIEVLGRNFVTAQISPELKRLRDWYPVVEVAVDDQHRRAYFADGL